MTITTETQQTLNKIVNGYTVKDKFYGTAAVNKAKLLFFGDDKLDAAGGEAPLRPPNRPTASGIANKWAKRWTQDEQNKAIYVTFFVKKIKHTYLHAKFIIGEGARLSVLGQRTIHKPKTSQTGGSSGNYVGLKRRDLQPTFGSLNLGQRTIHKPKTVAKRGCRTNITRRNGH